MAKYYCILFDADNTLLNFDAAENKALTETLVNYGIEPDAETVQTYRTINEELWRIWPFSSCRHSSELMVR